MVCNKQKPTYKYDVYEYDAAGVARKSDKIFTLDTSNLRINYGEIDNCHLCVLFFTQMFTTINTTSGFTARLEGPKGSELDIIRIIWRTPHWKLVRTN